MSTESESESEDRGTEPETPEAVAERLLADRQWPVTVTLADPFDFGREHVAALEFRRGRLGDLKGISTSPSMDELMLIASRMCGKPLKVIESLSDRDAPHALGLAASFFARCLSGGKKPSR